MTTIVPYAMPSRFATYAPHVIDYGVMASDLCSMTDIGLMTLHKDGQFVKDSRAAAAPPKIERKKLFVARSLWARDEPFQGEIWNLRNYDAALAWGQLT